MGLKKLSEIDNATDDVKASDDVIGVFGGKLSKAKVSELTKNDYTALENLPRKIIDKVRVSIEELTSGIYEAVVDCVVVSATSAELGTLEKGQIIAIDETDGIYSATTTISGGSYYIADMAQGDWYGENY